MRTAIITFTKSTLLVPGPLSLDQELVEVILRVGACRLERIISTGQATPAGEWYDQEEAEWVVLLSGEAGLVFENEPEVIIMKPGDYVQIPAHCRHRVEWTTPGQPTVWLALHYREEQGSGEVWRAGQPDVKQEEDRMANGTDEN